MPFVAECVFCNGKVRVPDHAVGWSIPCPKCGSSFTVAKSANQSQAVAKTKDPTATSSARTVLSNTPLPPTKASSAPTPVSGRSTGNVPPPSAPIVPLKRSGKSSGWFGKGSKKQLNGLGVAALFCGSFSLCFVMLPVVAALVPALYWLAYVSGIWILPVAGFGVFMGVLGLVAPKQPHVSGKFLPGFGLGVNVIALTFCVIGLRWLVNPPPVPAPAVIVSPPGKVTFMPAGDSGGGSPALIEESEYTDATRGSLLKDGIRVRVKKVELKELPLGPGKGATKTKDKYLVIAVQISNAGGDVNSQYRSWRGSEHQGHVEMSKKKLEVKTPKDFKPEFLFGVAQAHLPPQRIIEDVLVCEWPKDMPLTRADDLYVELPSAAFGRPGKLHFLVPKTMIAESEKQ